MYSMQRCGSPMKRLLATLIAALFCASPALAQFIQQNTSSITSSITFPVTVVGGTSGGIPYFNSTTQMSSSALLGANQVVVGGGAGNPPTTSSAFTFDGTKLTVASGTVTTSQPLTLTQTWNAGAVTFNGMLVNITNTASAGNGASKLFDFQVAGVSAAYLSATRWDGAAVQEFVVNGSAGANAASMSYGEFRLGSSGLVGWTAGGALAAKDLILARDAANTLALRNGTTAQAFRVYNTYTDASNYERLTAKWLTNAASLLTEAAGTGTLRPLTIGVGTTGAAIQLNAANTGSFIAQGVGNIFTFSATNVTNLVPLLFSPDNTLDIGASGATRPRNIYVGTNITVASSTKSGNYYVGAGTQSIISGQADGVITIWNNAASDFARLQFGGTTSSFPALKRSTTNLEVKLADDSTYSSLAARSIISSGTVPTLALAGGTCAGTAIAGGSTAGTVTLTGVCAATNTMTLSVMPTAPTGYACDATDRTLGTVALGQTGTSTTTAVFTFLATTGGTDVLSYKCIAY